jgi:hypothetical protein
MLHLLSHNKIFYQLNICELSVLRNVTANDLKRAIFFFFHNFTIYKERFDFVYKDKYNF